MSLQLSTENLRAKFSSNVQFSTSMWEYQGLNLIVSGFNVSEVRLFAELKALPIEDSCRSHEELAQSVGITQQAI